jgi:hypothetical protein
VAESVGPVETGLVHLKDFRIEYCIGCEGCLRRVHKLQKEVASMWTESQGYGSHIYDEIVSPAMS